jgi:hypothetical protein
MSAASKRMTERPNVTGGFGFTLRDDKNSGINTPCLTIAYATPGEAEVTRKLVVKGLGKARSATVPPRR